MTRFVTLGALNCVLVAALIAGRSDGQGSAVVPYYGAAYGPAGGFTPADAKRVVELLESVDRRLAAIEARAGGAAQPSAVKALTREAVARQHCFRCHSAEKADEKGDGFAMFAADGSLLKFKPFEENRINQTVQEGSMPKTGPRPSPEERAVFAPKK